MATFYRYLTGPDDSTFCHRVSEELSKGWSLYGGPTLAYDPDKKRMICGQALTKEVPGRDYAPDLSLSDL